MLTPLERYQRALNTGQYFSDQQQAVVVEHLQQLYYQLHSSTHGLKKWLGKPATIKGIYIWGSVGAGKTWLMDLFFDSLNFKHKWRSHFHDFMLDVHDQLQRWQGKVDPLEKIAKQFAKKTKILCFDEFFVSDIGDAMLLGNLFSALFREKVVIVATSNVVPDELYKNGLQRDRFLPAISLIKKHMQVLHLETVRDYRLRELEQAGVFFSPLTEANMQRVKTLFAQLAHGDIRYQRDIYLYDRSIKTLGFAENIIWFDFKQLCSVPRSQADYLSIAKRWPVVILSNVQQISHKDMNTAKHFINLIDILYDLQITLIMASAVAINDLYPEGELSFEFRRTRSRLLEMQSTAYLARTEEKRCAK